MQQRDVANGWILSLVHSPCYEMLTFQIVAARLRKQLIDFKSKWRTITHMPGLCRAFGKKRHSRIAYSQGLSTHQHISIQRFIKRGLESGNQVVRQPLDESYGVYEQRLAARGQHSSAHASVQRRKKLVSGACFLHLHAS